MTSTRSLADLISTLDWPALARQLDADGHTVIPGLLDRAQCEALRALYDQDGPFRSRVVMARHNFGLGEYRYFAYPLPASLQELREAFYPPLRAIANTWQERMGTGIEYPSGHATFLDQCHAAGQRRPTPLLLRYRAGDYNCLHQDLYGELAFPLQVAILLSRPGRSSPAANSSSPSSARACSRGRAWCRCSRVLPWCSPWPSARCAGYEVTIGSTFAMASADCIPASASPSG